MKLTDYRDNRKALLDAAQKLVDDGKLSEAEAKTKEVEALDAQFEKEKKMRDALNALSDHGQLPNEMHNENQLNLENAEGKDIGADSKAYHDAFFKHLLGRDDDMTQLENAAFTHTTTTTAAVLPTTMLNKIWDLISGQHAILGDVTIYRTGTILEIVKHTAIAKGAAKKVNENAANDDEQNTFVKVTLSGHDVSKHVNIS